MTGTVETPPVDTPPVDAADAEAPGVEAPPPEVAPLVPDQIEVAVPRDGRVIVVSDLHLGTAPTDASTAAATELAAALEAVGTAPGVLVIAGDGLEMLACPPDVDAILDAHPEFVAAVSGFAKGKGHRVVVLPGNHDGQLAWDPVAVAAVRTRLGASDVALACDLAIDTGEGTRRVHVVHGNQDDPYNAFVDPRQPLDTPLGHHVVRQVLPQIEPAAGQPDALLADVTWLNDTDLLPAFVGSRLLYRKVVGRLWWLVIPFAAALALRLAAWVPGVQGLLRHHAERWLIGLGVALVVVLVVAVVAAAATMLRVNRAVEASGRTERAGPAGHNAAARQRAGELTAAGYAGMVSGHSHEPELSLVGAGFYANSGCGVRSTVAHRARLGLPRPFFPVRRCSRVELVAGPTLLVRLVSGDAPLRSPVLLERLATRRDRHAATTPRVVAALPDGGTWPVDTGRVGTWVARRRVRRIAAAVLVIAGVLAIVSAFVRNLRALEIAGNVVPVTLHPVAGVGAVLVGLALIGLARSVRRGYRSAYVVAVVLLALSAVAHIVKGNHVEEAVVGLAIALWLLAERRHFAVNPPGQGRFARWVVGLAVLAIALAIGLGMAFATDQRLARSTTALAVGGFVLILMLAARPARSRPGDHAAALDRARAIVQRWGGGTLDYFALRDDKQWLFTGDSVVAYALVNRTMLVSPDPIGPPDRHVDAWAEAMDLADVNGWSIAVLAASEEWLPVYRAAGLTDAYLGDEAIVDAQRFSLAGGAMKSLRGAHNRIAKAGYRVEVLDPATVDTDLKDKLLALMTETRQGDVERGFSMTLSRIFDRRDTGLLLAVCLDGDGNPRAFNQYVPAAAVGGFSLDVMRRTSDPDAPNGLTDFVILETLAWMKAKGLRGLGLNFATMRGVLAGEMGAGQWRSLERRTLHHFSESMQIESLWKFNEKYDPTWRRRFIVTDTAVSSPREGVAMARVESVTEIPVLGKLLAHKGPDPAAPAPAPAPDLERTH